MWEAIAYVSSGVTLAAFVAAVAAWLVKAKSEEKGKLISLAKNEAQAKLVQDALEFFHVETGNLTKNQKFKVAMEQIRTRANRFKTIAFLIGFLALTAAVLSAYAISVKNEPHKPDLTVEKKTEQPDTFKGEFDQQSKKSLKIKYSGLYTALYNTMDSFISYSQQPPKAELIEYTTAEKTAKLWLVENKLKTDKSIWKQSNALLLKMRVYTKNSNKIAELLGGDGRPNAKELKKWSEEFQKDLNDIESSIKSLEEIK